jgi:hypothetical protein
MAKKSLDQNIDKRIENMWRVHKNRTDRGLGPTWSDTGRHESMTQDFNLKVENVAHTDMILHGSMDETKLDNAHTRWHKSFGDYPSHLADIDDNTMFNTDEFERNKKYKPLKKHHVGNSMVIPRQDSDE